MNNEEILELAKDYMNKHNVDIVLPGTIGLVSGSNVEIIFLKPMALDPDSIVCPPDNRVWVNTETKEVTWIVQM